MAKEAGEALHAKWLMEQEREVITRTIGEMMGRKMRGAEVDAGAIYRQVGGRSEFTYRLFAETFGSPAAKVKGAVSADPAVDTPFEEISRALIANAKRLAAEGVTNVTGRATGIAEVNPIGPIAGDYICLKIGAVAGGVVPWPGDPFATGPTTWVLGSAVQRG